MVGLVIYLALHSYNSYPKFYKAASGLFDLKGQNILIGKMRKLRFLKFLLTSLLTSITYYIAKINL
ncbi:hypothetical protein SAMN05661096_00824 [Marivirga sericea]|uniref:Uncharacterized protein n=1 Tax=Marivirga sericea TaxID=1028 RepID=A0A1X7IMD1_9BACT|nr:hypothetical protein SAMN05661096_00824 [Marivirga sericea]